MSWGNQVSTTTIVTTTTTQHTHEGSVENDFPNYQVAYGANSGKSPEYRADARIQQLANALRKDLEKLQGPFKEYVAETYRSTPDQTYHIKIRVAPGKQIEIAVYSSE